MTYDEILQKMFIAYYDARRHKRNTNRQLEFEHDLEPNIISLATSIYDGTYEVGPSICFIQNHPVKREVFAAGFLDRVVHHFLYNEIHAIFDSRFIYDSYSCRVGKGTLFGVDRLDGFIRSCSDNYSRDSYILKLDIEGYFMSLNKDILYDQIMSTLTKHIDTHKLPLLQNLIYKVIYNDPTKDAVFKGDRFNYIGLPKSKSLFYSKHNSGLPIGNLTSQLFSNIYLDSFDKYCKHTLNLKYYGRYVDDFVIVHRDKDYLLSIIPQIRDYLQNNLLLTLHPKKIYLQHYTKGVLFLGTYVKSHRRYLRSRTIGNFHQRIRDLNHTIRQNKGKANPDLLINFRQIINSYLGLLQHHKSYDIRKKILLDHISVYFWNHFYISGGYRKVVPRTNYSPGFQLF